VVVDEGWISMHWHALERPANKDDLALGIDEASGCGIVPLLRNSVMTASIWLMTFAPRGSTAGEVEVTVDVTVSVVVNLVMSVIVEIELAVVTILVLLGS
jgi:hypothetical protein